MYFNKEGQPSITEVAKEQKKLPPNFPIDSFLEAYEKWDKAPKNPSPDEKSNIRQGLFAELRDLHQQYGVNTNRGIDFWNTEEEMRSFGEFLKKIKANRVETLVQLSGAKEDVLQKYAELITIDKQEIKKGDIVILGEQNYVFTGNYKVDKTGKILEIEIAINDKPGYAKIEDITFPEKLPQKPTPTPAIEKEYKYSLEKYAGYATQELSKSGKSIKDLQEKLTEKKFYSGELSGKFDQATFEAVIKFQKSIPDIKYGVDGLVGPVTIGELFGIAPSTISGPTRRGDGLPETTRRPIAPAPSRLSSGSLSRPEIAEVSPTMVQLTQAMEQFRKTYQAVNSKTNKLLPDHEKDIESRNNSIQDAAKPVDKILQSLDPAKLSEQERKTYESMKLEVAKYFSNELSGVNSRQYTDYSFAFSLAENIIAPILKESKITLPKSPTQDDVEKRMQGINPSLYARYTEALSRGWTSGQFLSNPKIRAEWADVQSKINGEYEEAVQKKLAELKGNKAVLKTPEQYEALELMTTIMGSSNFLDFKKRNIDAWIQTGGAIGSGIGGAIAGVAIIGTTGWTGVGAIAGASVIGASIATAGGAISRGRYDERYLLTEGGINLVTFGVAGKIGMVAKAKYIDQGSKIAGYALDGTAGLALGVSGEYTRALSDGANFKDLPHGKMILMQLPWALLPMSMGGLAHLKGRSEKIQQSVSTIRSQANLGDHAGAARTAQAIAPEVESVANAARAQVQRDHAVTPPRPAVGPVNHVPATTPAARIQQLEGSPTGTPHEISNGTVDGYIGKTPEGKFQFIRLDKQEEAKIFDTAKGAHDHMSHEGFRFKDELYTTVTPPPVPERTPHVIPSTRPRMMSQADEQQFTEWFTTLIPKIDRKFPAGSTIKSEGVEITALAGGKYSMKHNGHEYHYDSHAEFTANIGKIIKTPSERLALLKSTESARILNHMKGYTGIEVPGTPGLRWKHDGHGKMSFERKNPENGSWSSVEIAALTHDEQIAAAAHWYSVKPSQIREGIKKAEGASLHEVVGHAEKEGFIKKHGLAAWHKVEEGFKSAKEKSIGGTKFLLWEGPVGLASFVTGIGKSTVTLKGAIGWGVLAEAIDLIASPEEREISWSNAGELAFRIAALRYMGVIRGTGAIFLQNWATGVYLDAPGAQVPVQK